MEYGLLLKSCCEILSDSLLRFICLQYKGFEKKYHANAGYLL
jgi:hypothetical protein